jgi:SAM-dependent methyltransferase
LSSSPSYLDPLVLPRITGETVLDAGCGYGRWAALIGSNFWEAGLERPPAVDGFDAFEPNVDHCRASGKYRRLWVQRMPEPLDGECDTTLGAGMLYRPSRLTRAVRRLQLSPVLESVPYALPALGDLVVACKDV